jgi:hypothetical protein
MGRAGVRHCRRGVRGQTGVLAGPGAVPVHGFDLPLALEIRESDSDSAYANDSEVWVITEDIGEAQRELQQLPDAMAKFTRDNGLALNGAKTQVMIGCAKAKAISNVTIHVDGAEVKPCSTFELLGSHLTRGSRCTLTATSSPRRQGFEPSVLHGWRNTSHVDNCRGSWEVVSSWASWHTASPS